MGETLAKNKKAYHDYFIEEKFEAGLVLTGGEVKGIRAKRVNIKDAFWHLFFVFSVNDDILKMHWV